MSNRLPVLNVLHNLFGNYQIFFFTYDLAWYEIVRQRIIALKEERKWEYAEFFAGSTFDHDLPIYAKDKNYIAKAKEYLRKSDYKAAVIYLRTHFEKIIKTFCNKHELSVMYQQNAKDLKSEDFWKAIRKGNPRTGAAYISDALAREVEEHRRLILNKLSHAEIVNIFRGEVEGSIKAIEDLERTLSAIPKGRVAPQQQAVAGVASP